MAAKTAQLKYLAEVTLGKMLQPAESIQVDQEMKPYLKASSITTSGLNLDALQEMPFSSKEQSHLDLRKNDVVVVEGGSIGRSAYIKEDLPGIHFQNSVNRVRPLPGNDGRYINYALMVLEQSGYFESITNLATIRHLTAEKLERVPIPVRSFEEQKRIADELDRELVEIDDFIADQQRLKLLLKEKLETSIEHEMWNQNFDLVPLKYISSILPGFAFKSSEFVEDDNQIPLLRGVNVGVSSLRWNDTVYLNKSKAPSYHQFRLQKDDLVLGLDRPVISNGVRIAKISETETGSLLVQRVARIRVKSSITTSDWVHYALNSSRFKAYLEPIFTGVSVPHISPDQLLNFKIPTPSYAKKIEIIDKCLIKSSSCNSNILDIENAITICQERKVSIIQSRINGR